MSARFEIIQHPGGNSDAISHLYIFDEEYNGEVMEVDGYYSIKTHDTAVEDPLKPITRTSADITLHIKNPGDLEDFISEIVEADEMRFTVRIFRNGNLKFRGHLVNDLIEIPDLYYPYDVQLTVSDGLNRLKAIDYKDDNGQPYTGEATIISHLIKLIYKIGFDYDTNFNVALKTFGFNWIEQNMLRSDAMLDNIRIQHALFQEYGTYPEVKYKNCYEVLEYILTAFNARIIHSEGVFIIYQVNEFYEGPLCVWKFDGNLLNTIAFNRKHPFTTNRTDGTWSYYPALKEATTSYDYKHSLGRNNLLPKPVPIGVAMPIGQFSGSDNHFIINLRIRSLFGWEINSAVFAIFKLRIVVGEKSFIGRYSTYYGNTQWKWQDGANSFYLYTTFGSSYQTNILQTEIITPTFDHDGEGMVWIELQGLYQTPEYEYPYSWDQFSFEVEELRMIQLQGNISGLSGSYTHKGINNKPNGTPVNSSVNKNLPNTIMGDGPAPFSVSRIEVKNEYGFWGNSEKWVPYSSYLGDSIQFHQLRLLEYIAFQKHSQRVFNFVLQDFVNPHETLVYLGNEFLIIDYNYEPEYDECKITCIQINIDRDNIEILEPVKENDNNGSGGSYSGGFGNPTQDTHLRLHNIIDGMDHAPADEENKGKIIGTNESTGAIEYQERPVNYWKKSGTELSPESTGDITKTTLKTAKIITTADGATALQITCADGTTKLFNIDNTNFKSKLYTWLSLTMGGDTAPSSVLDVIGSLGLPFRIVTAPRDGVSVTQQDTDYSIIADCSGGIVTVNLQQASAVPRRIIVIRLFTVESVNYLKIDPYSTNSIRGSLGSYQQLNLSNSGDWVELQSCQTSANLWEWYILKSNPNL